MLGVVVGGSSFRRPKGPELDYFLDIVNLEDGALRRIELGFLGHGFAESPREPHRAAIFEKKGPGGCFVDLRETTLLRTIAASGPDRAFYGHGAYSKDGSLLYVVETRLDTRAGLISVRDGETFDVLGEVPTYGDSPHDCMLLDDGRTMAMTNGGGPLGSVEPASVTFVDLQSTKLVEKLTFNDPRINAGHLAMTGSGRLAVVSAPRDGLPTDATGAVSFRSGGDKMVTMKKPPAVVRRMIGETLSVCIHEPSSVVVATHPAGRLVTFWDLPSMRLRKTWEVDSPRGVTLAEDGSCFVVSCGMTGGLRLISTETLELLPRSDYGTARLSGSHVYLWRAWRQQGQPMTS